MKILATRLLIVLAVFIFSSLAIGVSMMIGIGLTGLPHDLNNLTVYLLVTLSTAFALTKSKNLLHEYVIIATVVIAMLVLFLPKALNSSLRFTITFIPFFISFILAIASGYLYHKKRKFKLPVLFSIFPLALFIGLNSIWMHNTVYGSVSGKLENETAPPFKLEDQLGNVMENQSLKGKIVIMDFWFLGCPTCWSKFPKLQAFYNEYKSDDRIAIFAVNKLMKRDEPNDIFSSIENKGYDFPVVLGSNNTIESYGIDYYPTVIIIDQKGSLVFKGSIEKAKSEVARMLDN